MTVLVMPALARAIIEPHLPQGVTPRYFRHTQELLDMAPEADIGWFDLDSKPDMVRAIVAAEKLQWLSSIYAGIDGFPLDLLAQRGAVFTNGAGINAVTIAEYVVMGMLTMAKGYRDVVRAQDRHEWLTDSPGKIELAGSKALILGYGAIGKLLDRMLQGFAVEVTKVRRSPKSSGGHGTLQPHEWRARLHEFDWVILAVPATPETDGMIGASELAIMKSSAVLINIARGSVIDQEALVAALSEQRIGGAFLDVTSPEPLPADHPLWSLPNAHVTMHLSGRAQSLMFQRSAQRFLGNLARFLSGEPLESKVDLALGY